MSYIISLKIKPETHQHFLEIHQQLNAETTESLAKPLGDNLADIACEIIDQVFGDIAKMSKSDDHESEKIIQQILDTTRKYMPWSVSFFGNDRLKPMVNYLYDLTSEKEGTFLMSYPVEQSVVTELLNCVDQMKACNDTYVPAALKAFTEIVDQGVTHLIREPKKILKFNLVVDKTLNGIIHVTTQLGYRRFEKLGTLYDAKSMSGFFDHFLGFLKNKSDL